MTGKVLTTGRFCCNFAAKLNNKNNQHYEKRKDNLQREKRY